MDKLEKNNAFKEIIPKASLTEADKQKVMSTIANAKLFLDVVDLLSVKHIETRFKIMEIFGGGDESKK